MPDAMGYSVEWADGYAVGDGCVAGECPGCGYTLLICEVRDVDDEGGDLDTYVCTWCGSDLG
jgi:hypothetical protein